MGMGYTFECGNCGSRKNISLGSGMLFINTYKDVMEKAKSGRFGKACQTFLEENPAGAINTNRSLYVCEECGKWHEDYNLDLYKPKDEKMLPKPYVTFWKEEKDFELAVGFQLQCPNCKKPMKRLDDIPVEMTLRCPDCVDGLMDVVDIYRWD